MAIVIDYEVQFAAEAPGADVAKHELAGFVDGTETFRTEYPVAENPVVVTFPANSSVELKGRNKDASGQFQTGTPATTGVFNTGDPPPPDMGAFTMGPGVEREETEPVARSATFKAKGKQAPTPKRNKSKP